MREVESRPVADIAEEIIDTFRASGVRGIYISNDIDGTDPIFGHATGTPEPGGLNPSTVERLIQCPAGAFPVWDRISSRWHPLSPDTAGGIVYGYDNQGQFYGVFGCSSAGASS